MQPKSRPNYVQWTTYSDTDFLQAPGTVVLCCPADLICTRTETISRRCITPDSLANCNLKKRNLSFMQQSFQLTSAAARDPARVPYYLSHQLHQHRITRIHSPFYDPERSIILLAAWYATLHDHFTSQNLKTILHDRVYVTIASVTSFDLNTNWIPWNPEASGLPFSPLM